MISLPRCTLEALSPADVSVVLSWWAVLTESSRAQFVSLFDPRADSCSFALIDDAHGLPTWERLPIDVDDELFADPEEQDVDWAGDYFEYRLVNPEKWPTPLYEAPRTFHIGGVAPEPATIVVPKLSRRFTPSAERPPHAQRRPYSASLVPVAG